MHTDDVSHSVIRVKCAGRGLRSGSAANRSFEQQPTALLLGLSEEPETEACPSAEPQVRIHSPPAESHSHLGKPMMRNRVYGDTGNSSCRLGGRESIPSPWFALIYRSCSFPTAAKCKTSRFATFGILCPRRHMSQRSPTDRNIPLNGSSSSSIRKIALPIASEQHKKPPNQLGHWLHGMASRAERAE